jgi:molecular chaperone GrpE
VSEPVRGNADGDAVPGSSPGDSHPPTTSPDEESGAGLADEVAGTISAEDEGSEADGAAGEPEPDYKDMYLRALADAENTRKRARRDVETANARGVARLARELLPSLDNLDRALAAAEAEEGDPDHHLTRGIRLVHAELLAALERVGIEPFSPQGEPFDPHQHEAVSQIPADGAEPGTVAEVYQQGYRYKEEILRPARVVVAQ